MNRRQVTTGLGAIAAAPALPVKALASLPATGAAIPNPARFRAIYLSHLHGTCSPKTIYKVTGIDASITKGYLSRLLSEGVLSPPNMAAKVMSAQAKPAQKPSGLRKRLDKFLKETDEPEEVVEIDAPIDETDEEQPS
jgi:hypothetical protein